MTQPAMRVNRPSGIIFRSPRLLDVHSIPFSSAMGHGMTSDGEPCTVKVGYQALLSGHLRQRRGCVFLLILFEQCACWSNGPFHLPKRISSMKALAQSIQGSNLCKHRPLAFAEFRNSQGQVFDGCKWLVRACAHQGIGGAFSQTTHVAKAETEEGGRGTECRLICLRSFPFSSPISSSPFALWGERENEPKQI